MKTIVNIIFLLITTNVIAQDMLFKKDNSKLEVKILEITKETLKYKVFSNQSGPDYIISKNEVALIIYSNGSHETFKEATNETQTVPFVDTDIVDIRKKKEEHYKNVTQKSNVVFLNTLELMNSGLALSYFKELANNMIDIHVPLAISFDQPYFTNTMWRRESGSNISNYKLTQKHYDLGLGIYVNTSGKRAVTHFIGPMIRYAKYSGSYDHTSYDNNNLGYTSVTSNNYKFDMNETSVLLNNGFLYRITPNFNLMMNVAIGRYISRSYTQNDPHQLTQPSYSSVFSSPIALQGGFSFGYRF